VVLRAQAGVAEHLMVMLESSSAEVRSVAAACLGDLAAAHPPLQLYLTQVSTPCPCLWSCSHVAAQYWNLWCCLHLVMSFALCILLPLCCMRHLLLLPICPVLPGNIKSLCWC